jgi:adenylate cyclase
VSTEGNKGKASKGFLCSLGGFFVWGGDPMATGDVKRKLTAIFSADVEGYSRLMEEDELATIETLTSHKEIMRKLIRQYRGRVVDSTGDNLLAEFASVVDAVQCAVEVQQILSAKNETLPENRRMQFRIGINLGDVVEEGERIYGDGVNVAARVESLAEGGGISISGTAYDQLGKKLPLGYEYLGEQSVKNIEKPVRVYRILTEAEAAGKVIGEEKPKPKHLRWAVVGALAVLIIAAGVWAIWNFYLRPPFEPASEERMAFALPDKPSIAVLPFVNMSEDPKQEYFSDGLTEEIITALSKVPKVFVIARNSTFSYKGKSVKVNQVAEELGVRYVLEGSIRKAEDRVRITAQLIDAIKGHHLWAERYDRELKDIFAVQDEITMKVITALQLKLTDGELARLSAKGTENLQAYLKLLQAREIFYTITKEGNAQARHLLEEIIAAEPEFPAPYITLGATHFMDIRIGSSKSPKESLKRAFEFVRKAIALDDSQPIAHSILSFLYVMTRQHDKGLAESELAIALAPNSADAHNFMGLALTFAGRHEEAVLHSEQSLRLNPMPPGWYFRNLGLAYFGAGQYEEAIVAHKKALQLAPKDIVAHRLLTSAYSWAGRLDEARAQAEEIIRIDPKFSVEQQAKMSLYKNQADRERWLDGLRKAGLPETPPLPLPDKPSIAVLPFVNMSGDPEQEYFSDGITEEIITAISKTPKLFVIARTSSFKYKGKEVDVRTVGRELGVRYVLEGSVRRSEDQLRITAQLVDTKTGNHLWAERYDRGLKDIFALQDEITFKVIAALQVKLTEGEQALIAAWGADNFEAYAKFLQGVEYARRFNAEGNLLARKMAEEVIALDPGYPQGYRLLGTTHMMDVWFGFTKSPRKSLAEAVRLFQKVIDMHPSDAVTRGLRGFVYTMMRQHEKGIAELEKAIALNPNVAVNHAWLGFVLHLNGRHKEALVEIKKAIRLNPFPPNIYFLYLGHAYMYEGMFDESIAAYKNALRLQPNNMFAHLRLAAAYSLLGRENDAHAEAAEVLRINPKFSLERLSKTVPYKNQSDTDHLINALRKAGLK